MGSVNPGEGGRIEIVGEALDYGTGALIGVVTS